MLDNQGSLEIGKRAPDDIGALVPRLAGHIIAHRNDRMGARLIAMVNAMRIADSLDLPFLVGWTTHGRTSEEIRNPSDIFDQDFIADHFFGGDDLAKVWSQLINLGSLQGGSAAALQAGARQGKSYLSEVTIGSIVLPWEDEADVQADLPAYFKQIAFSPVVTAAMADIDTRFAGLSLRAYHIRRGDIISDPITSEKLWPNKYTPREFYEVHIRQFLQDGGDRCIVFSDTEAEIERLKAIDDRIVGFDDIVPDDGLTAGQRDLLELYSMSKCPKIFGPPESAFSQTAATIGGGKVYAVQTSLSEAAQATAMNLMADRMATPEKYFLGDGDLGQNFPFLIEHFEKAGQPARARDIIQTLVENGFSRSYAYPQLCKLSLAADDLDAVHTILASAKQRDIVPEEAMADLYAYAALAHMQAGDKAAALDHIQAAFWLRPLNKIVSGLLNMMLSAGWLADTAMYPIDADLVRNKGKLFPQNNPELDVFNALPMPEGCKNKPQFYPWDMAVRDWRFIHGKKLSRAFWQKGKLQNELDRLIRSSSKMAGSAQLASAASIYLRYLERFDEALKLSRSAEAVDPKNALYAKRTADALLESGQIEEGLAAMERAAALSQDNPYFLAHLGFWFGKAKMPARAYQTFDRVSRIEHTSVEIKLMTAEFLRRRLPSRDRALGFMEDADRAAHGSQRIQIAKGRLLLMTQQVDAAAKVYRVIAGDRTAHLTVFVQMYRLMAQQDHANLAANILHGTQFDPEEVIALATDGQTKEAAAARAASDVKAA